MPRPLPRERARSIASVLESNAARAEAERTLPADSVKALAEAGLFRFGLPAELGGEEADFEEALTTWEELARADGSAGWTAMANGSGAAAAAAFLSDDAVTTIFGDDPAATVGGQFAPRGTGTKEGDAWRVTGSYSFGSGSGHSAYVSAGFVPLVEGQPVMREDGLPDMRVGFVPHDEIRFTDGWHVMGLQGTGSYDYEVEDRAIPDGYAFPLFTNEPRRGGERFQAVFRMGMMPMTGAGHAAFALGVGKRALEEIEAIASSRQRMGDPTPIGGRLTFQKDFMRATATLRAARLLVFDTYGEAYRTSLAGDPVTLEQRAHLRAAAAWATEVAKDVCDFAHEKAGTTAIREGVIQRCFRDIHTGSQHAFIGEKIYTDSADVLLGNTTFVPGL